MDNIPSIKTGFPAMPTELIGKHLNGYLIRETIRQTKHAIVYRGYSPIEGQDVALKHFLIPQMTADSAAQFLNAAGSWAGLEHSGIVELLDLWYDTTDGAFLVMKWMSGGSLRDVLAQGALSPEATASLLWRVAGALYSAHRQGVIHRNIKPENILFDADGLAYLSDFAVDGNWGLRPGCSTPEMIAGQMASVQSDLYCLGQVLLECVTGHPPPLLDAQPATTRSDFSRAMAQLQMALDAQLMLLPSDLQTAFRHVFDPVPRKRHHDALSLATTFSHILVGEEPDSALLEQMMPFSRISVPGPVQVSDAPTQVAPVVPVQPGELLTGRTLGVYQVHELIARGGMGEVYKGMHPRLEREVAIKIMKPEFADQLDLRARFEREAKIVAKLRHPNIVTLYDFGEIEKHYFIVMEYINGYGLNEYLHHYAPIAVETALPIIQDIASALDYAHIQGIIHRDVKPSNVMLYRQDDPLHPHRAILMDFGITKVIGLNDGLTDTSRPIGTYDYMAPEQLMGLKTLDTRADIYSFGVMAYQMFTGKLPFRARTTAKLVYAHLQQPPANPREVLPTLPEHIAAAILRALEKNPELRYRSAGEFAAALVSG